MVRILSVCFLSCLAAASAAFPVRAADPGETCWVMAGQEAVNLRSEPTLAGGSLVAVLPPHTRLAALGVDASGDWFAVDFPIEGIESTWVSARVVAAEGPCDSLPVLPNPGPPAQYTQLMAVPVLPTLDPGLRAVFERGQALGSMPGAFTKVGDCNTDTAYFMAGFDQGRYDLGAYTDLTPSISFFAGSFEHRSLTGQVGFSALTMVDPLWADPALCEPGETPLACEYRRVQPSVAVVMFGANDLLNLTDELFEDSVTEIVELSLERGVIPVLTTFTWHRDDLWHKTLRFNVITLEVAERYHVPLINFWRAAQALPGLGLMDDYTHLTVYPGEPGDYSIDFTGDEAVSGYTLRNLLTLQTLDLLRREVLAGP